MYHILNHLSSRYDVTVAGFSETGDKNLFKKEFPELIGKMHFIKRRTEKYRKLRQLWSLFTPHSYWYSWSKSRKMQRMIKELLVTNSYDFIIDEFASMGHYVYETNAIRILDAHNVEYDNFHRMSKIKGAPIRKRFYEREYQLSHKEEVAVFNRHDAIFVTSRRDGDLIRKDKESAEIFVIPNGVETEYFKNSGKVDEEIFSMVFTGAMKYLPNNEGMLYFLEKIFPLIKDRVPNAKIYIVGSNPPSELKAYESASIIVTGFVEDVRPYVERSSVFVVPLNMGSGTRLKILESFSMKKPVVSTSIGCEGLEVEDGEHLLIRDDPETFADAVIALFKESDLRERLISKSFDLVKYKYDWKVVGGLIDEALEVLTNKHLIVGERKNEKATEKSGYRHR